MSAWLLALIFDLVVGGAIDQTNSPGAYQYWYWGLIALVIGLVALVLVTLAHQFENYKIPEGGAPPFLMSLFIGGAQISLLLTILQMIAMNNQIDGDFFTYPSTASGEVEKNDYRSHQRGLMVFSMLCKVYIVNFLKNNQAWAGPAEAMKAS